MFENSLVPDSADAHPSNLSEEQMNDKVADCGQDDETAELVVNQNLLRTINLYRPRCSSTADF